MTRVFRIVALAACIAAPIAAQDPAIAARMANVGGKSDPQGCKLESGHFRVSSGATYLQNALATSVPDNRKRLLHDGKQVLLQAITQNDQAKNPAAWYYLGRIDLLTGDFPGADSSLKKTVELKPDCAGEVNTVRSDVRTLFILADSLGKAGKNDSALYFFRAGYGVYTTSPYAPYKIAELYTGMGQADSATAYYEKAVAAATDSAPNSVAIRGNAAFTLGTTYFNAHRYPDAIRAFRIASQADPKDEVARKDLAIAFRAAGMADSAKALDDAALKAAQASGSVTPDQLLDLGVAQFNDKNYAAAAASFQKAYAAAPDRHDALANLANSYSAMDSTTQAIAAAEKLLALEPLNYGALQLLAKEYKTVEDRQKAKQKTKSFEAFTRLFAMTVGLEGGSLAVRADGATVKLVARGRAGMDAAGKALKPAPLPLVVEFLDASGAVVASQPLSVPALAADATQDLSVDGAGKGIVDWRYRKP